LSAEHILVPRWMRRGLAAVRAAVALGYLTLALRTESTGLQAGVAALYLGLALFALAGKGPREPGRTGLLLAADTTVFLLSAAWPAGPPGLWLNFGWFIFLQMAALLFHDWPQAALVGAASCAALGAGQPQDWKQMLAFFLGTTLLAVLAGWQKSQWKDRIFSASRQAVMFRSAADHAREQERERMADDFHDGPLQAFMSVQMRLEVLRKVLLKNPDAGLRELAGLQDLLKGQVVELRAFLRAMRPVEMDARELLAALSRLAASFQKETGISVALSGTPEVNTQPPEVAMEILKMVREALHNVGKHARATSVAVKLEPCNGSLHIFIHDNGCGFPFCGSYNLDELEMLRLGPASIKRRVRTLNGELLLESMPGRGSGLEIRIPQ
jgi:signal transduction histidine kinase